jgi:hypothetical protein
MRLHTGIDLVAKEGVPVVSAKDRVVKKAKLAEASMMAMYSLAFLNKEGAKEHLFFLSPQDFKNSSAIRKRFS